MEYKRSKSQDETIQNKEKLAEKRSKAEKKETEIKGGGSRKYCRSAGGAVGRGSLRKRKKTEKLGEK